MRRRLRLWSGTWASVAITASVGCQSTHDRFYPLGIYSINSTNDFPIVRAAGFNLITSTADRPHLDAARANGLSILASPGSSAGKDFDARPVRQTVKSFDSHPALWAWDLIDEPDMHGVSPRQIREANQFVKRLAARKPTALVLFQGSSANDYAHLTDILMIDRYPIPWLPLANFPQHVRNARFALGPKKPLIAVIQAFDWTVHSQLLPGRKNLRAPSREELRCMTYCALVRQATGLFYYAYDDGRWRIREHPDTWKALEQVVAEVNKLLPLFQAEHLWWPINHDFADPSSAFNAALESSVTPALLRVRTGNAHVPAGDYILAVNTTDLTHRYRVALPQPFTGEINVLGEDRAVAVHKNWIADEFQPYAVHIYGPMPQATKPKR